MAVKLVASDLEIEVYTWLTKKGIHFEFQSKLIGGYSRELGDAEADFVLRQLEMVWRVMGEYFHRGVTPQARDLIQKVRLQEQGWQVIDLWEEDLKKRLNYTLTMALRGQEI